ncbi:MAG: hypothetical protein KAT46_03700 [Deltaproteobacteria bacterium]|nr:hypothetical protein [Deltaproteobacteria bacterium]
MKNLKLILKVVIALTVVLGVILFLKKDQVLEYYETRYARDMDIIRLNGLKDLGLLFEEYERSVGGYPFGSNRELASIVFIATKEQNKYTKTAIKPDFPHQVIGVKGLIDEIERVLGREILMPFDPQRVPLFRPNFYVYTTSDGGFFLTISLYGEYSFATTVSKNYSLMTLSSETDSFESQWTIDDLLTHPDFLDAVAEELNKPRYVEKLRKKLAKKGLLF